MLDRNVILSMALICVTAASWCDDITLVNKTTDKLTLYFKGSAPEDGRFGRDAAGKISPELEVTVEAGKDVNVSSLIGVHPSAEYMEKIQVLDIGERSVADDSIGFVIEKQKNDPYVYTIKREADVYRHIIERDVTPIKALQEVFISASGSDDFMLTYFSGAMQASFCSNQERT